MNILIVDDSRTVHGFIEKTLAMAGVHVDKIYHAFHGKEGLALLEEHPVDLIFSDIHMPEMTGIEMIEAIKQRQDFQSIPIIIISTEGSKVRIEQLQDMGVNAFLRKPFTPEQLKELVDAMVGGLK
jgi:two-component system chemotaxis response regulator CheY